MIGTWNPFVLGLVFTLFSVTLPLGVLTLGFLVVFGIDSLGRCPGRKVVTVRPVIRVSLVYQRETLQLGQEVLKLSVFLVPRYAAKIIEPGEFVQNKIFDK